MNNNHTVGLLPSLGWLKNFLLIPTQGRDLDVRTSPQKRSSRGWVEDGIDPQPGQPGLRLRDTLVEVNGTSLKELSDQELVVGS
jgi:hypothetical protein